MKTWLDNVTDEQIKTFIRKRKNPCDVEIQRKGGIIRITTKRIVPKEYSEGKETEKDKHYYYYNEFGEGYIYKNQFMLEPFDGVDMEWFNMVNHSNANVTIEGKSYYEAFIQAYVRAKILDINIKNTILSKQITELQNTQKANQERIMFLDKGLDAGFLENEEIKELEHGDKSLIVRCILSKMKRISDREESSVLKEEKGLSV